MSTKRRLIKRNQRRRITSEAVEAFLAGDEKRLHRALGLYPWDASPLDSGIMGTCIYPPGACIAQSWGTVQELRRLLDAATASINEQSSNPESFNEG